MKTRTLTLDTRDGPMDLDEAKPADARAAVIVVQEAFGVNDHIQDVTGRIAAEGYHAVAPHFFHRAGGGTVPYGDFSKVLPKYEGLDDAGIERDLQATLDHLEQAGWSPEQVGIVGFCFGGRVTFLAALRFPLGAAVGFYGGGIVTARFPQFPALAPESSKLQAPWLGLFGDQDPSIPVDDVEQLRSALEQAPVDTEIVRYADAGHGFFRDVSPDAHHPDSATDAWQRTLDWFERHLKAG